MHGDEQNMFVFTKAQNARTQEWAGFQVEGKRGFRDGAFFFFGIAGGGREVAEVVQRDKDRTFGMNDLRGSAIGKGKSGAKDFVAADDFIDAALEDRNVQRTGDAETNSNVPRGVAGSEAIQIPERLLRDGRRKGILRIGEASPGFIGLWIWQSVSYRLKPERRAQADSARAQRGQSVPRCSPARPFLPRTYPIRRLPRRRCGGAGVVAGGVR